MKRLLSIVLLFSLQSCTYFEKQVPSEQELFEKQLKEINWKEVDEYPSVGDCEKLQGKAQREQCFFIFLTTTIQQKLALDTISAQSSKMDTIVVKVTVFPNATLQFEPQFPKDVVRYDTIKIDSLLRARLIGFPKINPAIKRGIPVKTQFVLPVIIKLE